VDGNAKGANSAVLNAMIGLNAAVAGATESAEAWARASLAVGAVIRADVAVRVTSGPIGRAAECFELDNPDGRHDSDTRPPLTQLEIDVASRGIWCATESVCATAHVATLAARAASLLALRSLAETSKAVAAAVFAQKQASNARVLARAAAAPLRPYAVLLASKYAADGTFGPNELASLSPPSIAALGCNHLSLLRAHESLVASAAPLALSGPTSSV
jgi:hypothetical protein